MSWYEFLVGVSVLRVEGACATDFFELCRALEIIVSGLGYTVSDDNRAPLVTDDEGACDGKRALFVGREEPTVKVAYLHRPFSEEALENAEDTEETDETDVQA